MTDSRLRTTLLSKVAFQAQHWALAYTALRLKDFADLLRF